MSTTFWISELILVATYITFFRYRLQYHEFMSYSWSLPAQCREEQISSIPTNVLQESMRWLFFLHSRRLCLPNSVTAIDLGPLSKRECNMSRLNCIFRAFVSLEEAANSCSYCLSGTSPSTSSLRSNSIAYFQLVRHYLHFKLSLYVLILLRQTMPATLTYLKKMLTFRKEEV